ncbi:hypothetical protein [Intrasporangium sp. YIM S08009]|uniref:hypothetical protein n=1 Tax=Intrasporangium zincisolvens TaxID=3080018 RepID=UPI002B059741|nr:hypothetical protein [Intrasporangium sp. YIM S08009]
MAKRLTVDQKNDRRLTQIAMFSASVALVAVVAGPLTTFWLLKPQLDANIDQSRFQALYEDKRKYYAEFEADLGQIGTLEVEALVVILANNKRWAVNDPQWTSLKKQIDGLKVKASSDSGNIYMVGPSGVAKKSSAAWNSMARAADMFDCLAVGQGPTCSQDTTMKEAYGKFLDLNKASGVDDRAFLDAAHADLVKGLIE